MTGRRRLNRLRRGRWRPWVTFLSLTRRLAQWLLTFGRNDRFLRLSALSRRIRRVCSSWHLLLVFFIILLTPYDLDTFGSIRSGSDRLNVQLLERKILYLRSFTHFNNKQHTNTRSWLTKAWTDSTDASKGAISGAPDVNVCSLFRSSSMSLSRAVKVKLAEVNLLDALFLDLARRPEECDAKQVLFWMTSMNKISKRLKWRQKEHRLLITKQNTFRQIKIIFYFIKKRVSKRAKI